MPEPRFPRLPLATLPTPVEAFPIDGADAWIKRDDLTAKPYGGNKIRKLEFLLADAKQAGAKRLITVGAAGSHHALATTIYGKAAGFDVTAVLFPQPLTDHVRDTLLLDVAYGAELRYTPRMEMVPAALFVTSLKYRSQNAYVIPAGGSDAVGTLGYVEAARELATQVALDEAPMPKTVVVAAGTLGTVAGLAIGFEMARMPTQIKAIRITSRLVTNERALTRLIRDTQVLMKRNGIQGDFAEGAIKRVEIVHGFLGHGYGKETPAGIHATSFFEERGVQLDPTYTAKAAAAFLANAPAMEQPVLFWQTLSATTPVEKIGTTTPDDLPQQFRDYVLSGVTA